LFLSSPLVLHSFQNIARQPPPGFSTTWRIGGNSDAELPQTSSDSAEHSFNSVATSSRDTWASDSWDLGGFPPIYFCASLMNCVGTFKVFENAPSGQLRRMSSMRGKCEIIYLMYLQFKVKSWKKSGTKS
jgi:hypothetical protein